MLNTGIAGPYATESVIAQSCVFKSIKSIDDTMRMFGIHLFYDKNFDKEIAQKQPKGCTYCEQTYGQIPILPYKKMFRRYANVVSGKTTIRKHSDIIRYCKDVYVLMDYTINWVRYRGFCADFRDAEEQYFEEQYGNVSWSGYGGLYNDMSHCLENRRIRAANAMNCEEYDKAEKHYNIVLQMDPADLTSRLNMCLSLYKIKRYPDALTNLKLYSNLSDDPSASLWIGLVLYKMEQYDEARKYFKKTIMCGEKIITFTLNQHYGHFRWLIEAQIHAYMVLYFTRDSDDIAHDIRMIVDGIFETTGVFTNKKDIYKSPFVTV